MVTLNGFPYRGFHQEVVKYRVYSPDWGCADRLGYTLALAEILAALLPDDVTEGTISTLPLAWRTGWTGAKADATARMLAELARGLRELSGRVGKVIRVGFEPEPGCVVETTAQAARHLRDVDRDFLGVCLDACHLAVGFEDPAIGLDLPIVKLQASCAIEAPPEAHAALASFDEPRFLHQSRSASGFTDDLAEALAGGLPAGETWRVHFHMPLHAAPPPPLTTRPPTCATYSGPWSAAPRRAPGTWRSRPTRGRCCPRRAASPPAASPRAWPPNSTGPGANCSPSA